MYQCKLLHFIPLEILHYSLPSQGSIHKGLPTGKEELIHGLNTYVTGNTTNPRATIVLYSDVFGLALPNNKLLADAYANNGEFLVYLPDFFEGDPLGLAIADVLIPTDAKNQSNLSFYTGLLANVPTFIAWATRHKDPKTTKACFDFMGKLRRATPLNHKIGMVGTCWGGQYALRAARAQNKIEVGGAQVPVVDAVVALHPSNLVLPRDVEEMIVPTSIGWGLKDTAVSFAQKGKIEEIQKKEKEEGKKIVEAVHQVYTPGRHGFAVRGNPDDPEERKILEDSLAQVVDFFKKQLWNGLRFV